MSSLIQGYQIAIPLLLSGSSGSFLFDGDQVIVSGSVDSLYGFTGSLYGTASYALNGNVDTSSFATTGSNTFKGTQTITGSYGKLIYDGNITPNTSLAEVHAANDNPWLHKFYNDSFSTSSAVMAYFGWNDGKFVFHNESTQSIGLQVNGWNAENGLLVYSDKVAFVNNIEVTGSITAPSITGSLQGTASYTETSITSSYPISTTGDTLFSTNPRAGNNLLDLNPDHSIFFGFQAGDGALTSVHSIFMGYRAGYGAQTSLYANFFGENAGYSASDASYSNMFGSNAGQFATNAQFSNFIGTGAGKSATNASASNFLGPLAGREAINASYSNFFGEFSGFRATNADNSNFFGYHSGYSSSQASHSIFMGYQVGKNVGGIGVGANNIILGTNITLENNRKDSINIGSIIFATGSHFSEYENPYSGSMMGKVGINKSLPLYNFDVSGSGNFDNNLTVTGSFDVNIKNNVFLIQSESQIFVEISGSNNTNIYSDLFIIKNFTTKQPVLTVSQSIVQFATQSFNPTGTTQAGSIWFTSTNMYIGLD